VTIDDKLESIFSDDLRELMVVSYIVLGNNAVTNRFIERTFRMPVQAWSSLYAIGKFPGIRAKEIKTIFPRPQNTISRAIALLETRGLIRQEISIDDGREKRLFTTTTGREMLKDMVGLSRLRQVELFSPLTDEERKVFFDLARKIAAGPHLLQSHVMGDD
jgi:DNA-binding MarR family transcriptional regulator